MILVHVLYAFHEACRIIIYVSKCLPNIKFLKDLKMFLLIIFSTYGVYEDTLLHLNSVNVRAWPVYLFKILALVEYLF